MRWQGLFKARRGARVGNRESQAKERSEGEEQQDRRKDVLLGRRRLPEEGKLHREPLKEEHEPQEQAASNVLKTSQTKMQTPSLSRTSQAQSPAFA